MTPSDAGPSNDSPLGLRSGCRPASETVQSYASTSVKTTGRKEPALKKHGFTFRGLGAGHGIQLNETSERAMARSRMDLEDAVFHYTTARGLFGILSTGQLWSTALVATNDESEFEYGQGVLASALMASGAVGQVDAGVEAALKKLGIEPAEVAASFEDHVVFLLDHFISGYVTSFCRARSEKHYLDGLLSQWRGYAGEDGYAIEFSKTKLASWIGKMGPAGFAYGLHDVFYERHNPVRAVLENVADALAAMFAKYVVRWANHTDVPFFVDRGMSGRAAMYDVFMTMEEAVEVAKAYFGFLASTKDPAFEEEAELRLSAYIHRNKDERPVKCFLRNGVLVPYIASPKSASKELLGAISAIVIGPGLDTGRKRKGLEHYLRANGLENVGLRRSAIPLSVR